MKAALSVILAIGFVVVMGIKGSQARSRATLTLEAKTSCQGEVREFCYDLEGWFYDREGPYWISYVATLRSPEGLPLEGAPIVFLIEDEVVAQKSTNANGQAKYTFYADEEDNYTAQAIVGTYFVDENGDTQFNRDVQVWDVASNKLDVAIEVPELAPDLPRPPVSSGGLSVDTDELIFENASLTGGDWKYIRVVSGAPPFLWDNVYKEYGEIAPRGLWGEMGIYTVQPRTLGLLNADLLISAKPVTDTVIVTDASGNRTEVQVVIDYLTFDDVSGQLP